jgi:hypothetical protein
MCSHIIERNPRSSTPVAEDEMGGDPELEAAAAAERRAKQAEERSEEEEGSDEDDWDPKDVKEVAKKQRQMAKGGITFESKMGPGAKVNSYLHTDTTWPRL